jgi:seryl-tRNA synthetase
MFDVRWIRDNPDAFDAGLARRGLAPLSSEIAALDAKRRAAQTDLQELQTRRNEASKQIGVAKKNGENADALIAEVAGIKDSMQALDDTQKQSGANVESALGAIPNLPSDDVPDGADETSNVELRRVGDKPGFDFAPKEHHELGEALSMMDFQRAAKLSGARFVVLSGALARLERALGQFMLDLQTTEHGYTEINPPALVRDTALFGTGQLPKFGEDLFRTTSDHWLIPTAEVPLTNLVADEILEAARLPLRFTALTPCFRSEAGAAGKDTHGMIRQHQFTKVELVSVVHPDASDDEHERMTRAAEAVLERLGLHYRVVVLSTGDMGFSARKTYDIEVWLPGQDTFREISSCSNCGEFQARRMGARFRPEGAKGTEFVHTLNGSGLAVGRALIAVMETYQQSDGSIVVPDALRPYMGGLDVIAADGG